MENQIRHGRAQFGTAGQGTALARHDARGPIARAGRVYHELIRPFVQTAEAPGKLPDEKELQDAGVRTFEGGGASPNLQSPKHQISALLSKLESESGNGSSPPTPLVATGVSLPALPSKLVTKILTNDYIDFAELPLAKGRGRPIPQSLDGQIIVVQAADLLQVRKLIPDLATWLQCFAIYVATIATKFPGRISELMAYQTTIAKASMKYKWPSWVVYDQNFRQEAAGNPTQSWAKVDPSIYAQCFTGQALTSENWCAKCQSLDHSSANCPTYRQRKRPWSLALGAGAYQQSAKAGQGQEICFKFNKYNGDCRFGKDCRHLHICSNCREPHPVSRCKAAKGGR